MCKVLENRAQQDEERMDQLTNQLKEARLLAEDADGKSDEVRTLALDNFYLQKGEESSLGIFIYCIFYKGIREKLINNL